MKVLHLISLNLHLILHLRLVCLVTIVMPLVFLERKRITIVKRMRVESGETNEMKSGRDRYLKDDIEEDRDYLNSA